MHLKKRCSILFVFLTLAIGKNGLCQEPFSTFAKLNFGGDTYIEVPRNWKYLDENLRGHLDTFTEAVTHLAGVSSNPGENVILVAGNAYTSFRTSSATLRLSMRLGDAPTQADMRDIAKLPKVELVQLLTSVSEKTRRLMLAVDGLKSVKTIDARIALNQGMTCMFFEFENDTFDGVKLSQTYICPLGSKSVKLSTSYRKSETMMFQPVIKYVWQSLRIN